MQGQVAAVDGQHQTQEVIAHALGMAICGSELQFAAQSAQGGRRQNQNADDNNRNRRDNDNADNNQNRRDNDNADNNRNRRDNDDNQGQSQAQRAAAQQLRQQAWHQFESSNQLLQATDTDLRASEANRDGDRSSWSRRLLTVSSQYANTLRSLSGVSSNRPSGTVGGQDDQDQANNRNNDQNRNQGGNNLGRTEVAQVTLINHAVGEAIQAFQLRHPNNASRFAAQNASGQRLQAHARQMSSESQQLLQNVISNANWQRQNDNQGERQGQRQNDNQGERQGQRQNDNQGERQGQASVQSLAQQAQQVIDTLQRISGGTAGQARPADRTAIPGPRSWDPARSDVPSGWAFLRPILPSHAGAESTISAQSRWSRVA